MSDAFERSTLPIRHPPFAGTTNGDHCGVGSRLEPDGGPPGQHSHLPVHQAAPKPVATGASTPTTTTAFTRLNTAPVAEARHSTN
jgi:hypothetical protein